MKLVRYLVAAVILFSIMPAHAVGWVKEPGEIYTKLSTGSFFGDGFFDEQGKHASTSYDYFNQSVNLYGEVGVLPRTAIVFNVPWLYSKNTLEGIEPYRSYSFGDMQLGLNGQIYKGPVALAVLLKAQFPLYGDDFALGGTGQATDQVPPVGVGLADEYYPAIGDGSFDLSPLLQLGVSMYPLPGWFSAEVGPKFRFGGFGDGIEYSANLGYFVIEKYLAPVAVARGVYSFGGDHEKPTKAYHSFGGGLIIGIYDGLSFEAEAAVIPIGEFTSKGWTLNAGLSYQGRLFPDPFGDAAE